MTPPGADVSVENPTLTAEEIGRRFLELIRGLESRQDLSLEKVQAVIGLVLQPSQRAGFLGHTQQLHDGWFYSLSFVPGGATVQRGIGLDFGHRSGSVVDMTPVCAPDFDTYHRALQGMGYRAVEIPGELGELRSVRYHKGDLSLSIIPRGVMPGKGGICVESIGTLN